MVLPESGSSWFYDPKKNEASAAAGQVCVDSFSNSPFIQVDLLKAGDFNFRDPRGFRYTDKLPFVAGVKAKLEAALGWYPGLFEEVTGGLWLPKWYTETIVTDGVGTKVELANALYTLISQIEWKHGRHIAWFREMAKNLIAMSADDIARYGWLPLLYSNVIDYSKLDDSNAVAYRELMLGLGDILKKLWIVLMTGESAKLSQFVGSENPKALFPFNWSGAMQWLYHEKLNITGEEVREWDYIVLLWQGGVRSNGITKIREYLALMYGKEWWNNPAALADIEEALTPSVVYSGLIAEVNGWHSNGERKMFMTGIGHISWGGLEEKVLPMFANKWLSANIDNPFPIPGINGRALHTFREAEKPMTIEEAFGTWPMGQGMAVTFRTQAEAEAFIALAKNKHDIEARIGGRVIKTPKWQKPHLQVTARYNEKEIGEKITLPPLAA